MSEVEKMYALAGVEEGCTLPNLCRYKEICAKPVNCEHYDYPDFTAEKQLELIKWLIQNKRLCVRKAEYSNNFYMDTIQNRSNGVDSKNFEVCLASQINTLWQDLTETERNEIRDILRG